MGLSTRMEIFRHLDISPEAGANQRIAL